MPKGIFTQTFCLLTSREIPIAEIAEALKSFEILGESEAKPEWQFGAASVVLSYQPQVNGQVAIDAVAQRWPDEMGDANADMTTFSAWSVGSFGPFTYPNNLLRAGQQSWSWAEGRGIAHAHTGFIRLRSSYAFGGGPDTPVLPKDYQPMPELEFLTKVSLALLEIPGTLCYFNPGGEVLRDKAGLKEMLAEFVELQLPPLPAWCNTRLFKLTDDWMLMDTVGHAQLDLPDVEVIFPIAEYKPPQIDNYVRDVSMYLLNAGADVIKDGDKIDGPGETDLTWYVERPDDPYVDPPRSLLRLIPAKHKEAAEKITHRQ